MTMTLAELAALPLSGVDSGSPLRVAPDDPLFEVVERMHQHGTAAVLVEDDGVLVGIFTERDLMSRVDHGDPAWQDRPVREVMTQAPTTARADQTLEEALTVMLVGEHRHLPTIAATGETDALLSILDLLVHISEFFPEEFVNLPGDPEHEARARWGG